MDGGGAVRRLRLRYDGLCACGTAVSAGPVVGYDPAAQRLVCSHRLEGAVGTRRTSAPASRPVAAVHEALDGLPHLDGVAVRTSRAC